MLSFHLAFNFIIIHAIHNFTSKRNIFIQFSRIFNIIPYLIFKKRSKKVDNNDKQNTDVHTKFTFLFSQDLNEFYESNYKYIFISAIIFFLESIMFVYTLEIKSSSWLLYILFASLLYYLILKIKLYKHHYLSMILIIIIGLVIDLVLENFQNDIINNTVKLIIRYIRELLFSLYIITIKYMTEKQFCSIYKISWIHGILNVLLFIIFAILDYYFIGFCEYETYFNNFNGKEFLVILAVMATQLGLELSILITVKNYSPCHVFIILVFGQLAYYIDFSKDNSVLFVISLFLILFLSLIFSEIIELNFFGLSKNTKRNITFRADSDIFESIEAYSGRYSVELNDKTSETDL